MIGPRVRSMRAQLALLGISGMIIPLAILVGVVFATESEVESEDMPGGATTTEVTETVSGVSPLVPITATALAAVAAVGVWLWAGRAVRPLQHIARVADEIQAGSLDRRINLEGAPAEVATLANSFDQMLSRLAAASTTQRQLIEDTSHELRTPLAALAATAEVTLAAPDQTAEEYRSALRRIDAMTDRLQAIIESLLSDARARGSTAGQTDNDLMVLVERAVSQQRTLSPGLSIEVTGPDRLLLGIDGPSVERAVRNLVENAARFSPDGGTVSVAVDSDNTATWLTVSDDGPGIDPEGQDRIFDRYYRGKENSGDGRRRYGIGLALVEQVAQAYGGITVESPLSSTGGSRFTITLPAPPDPNQH